MPDDLMPEQGVDEGSQQPEPATHEKDVVASTEPTGHEHPHSAAPVPPSASRQKGPGQELSEGEG